MQARTGITLRIMLPSDLTSFFSRKSSNTESVKREGEKDGLLFKIIHRVSSILLGFRAGRLSDGLCNGGYILSSIKCCSKLPSFADGLLLPGGIVVTFVVLVGCVGRLCKDAEDRLEAIMRSPAFGPGC